METSFITRDPFDPMHPSLRWRSQVRVTEERIMYLENASRIAESAQYWEQKFRYTSEILELIRRHVPPEFASTSIAQPLSPIDSSLVSKPNKITGYYETSSTRKGKLTQTVSRQPSKRACKISRDDKRPQSMERVEHNSEDRQRVGQAGQAAKRRRTTHEPGSRPCARRVRPTRTQRHTRYFQRDAGERRLEPYLCGGHKLR